MGFMLDISTFLSDPTVSSVLGIDRYAKNKKEEWIDTRNPETGHVHSRIERTRTQYFKNQRAISEASYNRAMREGFQILKMQFVPHTEAEIRALREAGLRPDEIGPAIRFGEGTELPLLIRTIDETYRPDRDRHSVVYEAEYASSSLVISRQNLFTRIGLLALAAGLIGIGIYSHRSTNPLENAPTPT